MKACNSMKLQFEGRSVNEAFSRTAVAAFIAQLDPTIEELSDAALRRPRGDRRAR